MLEASVPCRERTDGRHERNFLTWPGKSEVLECCPGGRTGVASTVRGLCAECEDAMLDCSRLEMSHHTTFPLQQGRLA